jgi:magnesium-transporting ATPase (P-type)
MVFLGGATLGNSPFSVIQLLWINLIMDTLAAIGLASEPPVTDDHDENAQDHQNHSKNDLSRIREEKIIKESMWRNVLIQAVYQILVLVVMLYSVPYWFPNSSYNLVETDFYTDSQASQNMKQHYTIIYNTFVMMTLANQISCRKLGWSDMRLHSHIFNNKWFILVVAAELGVQALIIEFPVFN